MSDPVSPSDRADKLQVLLDKQEIHEALMRYCLGIDRCDLALVLSVFHEDALDNHSGVEERAVDRFTRTINSRSMWVNHNIGNVFIQVDGAKAVSQSYFTAWHRLTHDERTYDWVIAGRYLDRFERRQHVWRIAHRTVVYDCERFDRVSPDRPVGHPAATFFEKVVRGERSQQDFSYQLMRF
ncbi:MAG TPA: nuclear transport factor 2 family protein [Steroidobacteraceae bacterium]|jgi:hypothetical protein|nr:nuclear transport factor 2 family protein [Steroidobacteraceae bacterium]